MPQEKPTARARTGGATASSGGAVRAQVAKRRRRARPGGEAAARQVMALREESQGRADDEEDAEHAGGRRVAAGFADELLPRLDGEDRHVLGEHEGDAEILQRVHEDEKRAGEHRRHHDRQDHRPPGAPARGAEILPGLLDRDVDRLERRQGRQQDIGKERQRVDDDEAGRAVDRIERDADGMQGLRDDPGAAEEEDERIGADERGQDERQGRQGEKDRLAGDPDAGKAEGERHADQRGDDGGDRADGEAVAEGALIEWAAENAQVIVRRDMRAGGVEDARLEDAEERVNEEEAEKGERQQRDDERKAGTAHRGTAHHIRRRERR
jgi:hypothetical protein